MTTNTKGDNFDLTKAGEILQKVAKPMITVITTTLPIIITACQSIYSIYVKLPLEGVRFLIGFVFCFFGGIYPTMFAAIQAAKHGGLKTVSSALSDLAIEATTVIEESKKDDKADDDNDGISDVDQIDGKALILRKTHLVMTKINPEKVDKALTSLSAVWVSVIATLSVRFARVITLALTISDFIKKPVNRFITPVIQSAIPKEYSKWVPVVIGWIAKSIAMSVAWYIQSIISAFTSALEGGLIMARTTLRVLVKKGFSLWGLIPENHEDSSLDEYMSYVFAALGFYFQFSMGFDVPFPFNILLLPFEIAESYIQWTVTTE